MPDQFSLEIVCKPRLEIQVCPATFTHRWEKRWIDTFSWGHSCEVTETDSVGIWTWHASFIFYADNCCATWISVDLYNNCIICDHPHFFIWIKSCKLDEAYSNHCTIVKYDSEKLDNFKGLEIFDLQNKF